MNYLSYLLRLWRVDGGPTPIWRASLQRPGTAEPIYFGDLEALVAFLRAEMGEDVTAEPSDFETSNESEATPGGERR